MSRNGPSGSSVPGLRRGGRHWKKFGHRGNSVQPNFALAQWPRPPDWRCMPTRLVAVAHRVRIRRGVGWRAGGGNAMGALCGRAATLCGVGSLTAAVTQLTITPLRPLFTTPHPVVGASNHAKGALVLIACLAGVFAIWRRSGQTFVIDRMTALIGCRTPRLRTPSSAGSGATRSLRPRTS
jgi:hypothetical protein